MKHIPWLLIETTDGGADHKNVFLTNRAALAAVVDFFDMACAILFRNAPSGSWANPVERIMSILNMGLQNCSYERSRCSNNELESILRRAKSMAHLRELSAEDSRIQTAWSESVKGCLGHMSKRFERLHLKDKPVIVVVNASADDVLVLQEALKAKASDYNPVLCASADLAKMPEFARRLLQGKGQQTTYLTEVRGTMNRVPDKYKHFLEHRFPMPWINLKEDPDHHMSFADIRHLLGTEGLVTNEKFRPSADSKNKKGRTYRDRKIAAAYPKIFRTYKHVRAFVRCMNCHRPHCIYATKQSGFKGKRMTINSIPYRTLLVRYSEVTPM
jgi:hypothetical protein